MRQIKAVLCLFVLERDCVSLLICLCLCLCVHVSVCVCLYVLFVVNMNQETTTTNNAQYPSGIEIKGCDVNVMSSSLIKQI